jgi:hypothetical protein
MIKPLTLGSIFKIYSITNLGLNLLGVASYIVGALLYLAGGIASESGQAATGAKLWVAGSGWFVLGAFCFVLAGSPPPLPTSDLAVQASAHLLGKPPIST